MTARFRAGLGASDRTVPSVVPGRSWAADPPHRVWFQGHSEATNPHSLSQQRATRAAAGDTGGNGRRQRATATGGGNGRHGRRPRDRAMEAGRRGLVWGGAGRRRCRSPDPGHPAVAALGRSHHALAEHHLPRTFHYRQGQRPADRQRTGATPTSAATGCCSTTRSPPSRSRSAFGRPLLPQSVPRQWSAEARS